MSTRRPASGSVAAELLARDGFNGMGLKALSDAHRAALRLDLPPLPRRKEEIAATAILANAQVVGQLLEANLAEGVTDDAIRRMFAFMAERLEASDWSRRAVSWAHRPGRPDGRAPPCRGACAPTLRPPDRDRSPRGPRTGRDGPPSDARALALTLVARL